MRYRPCCHSPAPFPCKTAAMTKMLMASGVLAATLLALGGWQFMAPRPALVPISARPLDPGRVPQHDRNLLLKDALAAARSGDVEATRAMQARMEALDAKIAGWMLALSGNSAITPDAIRTAMSADWPGGSALARNLERAQLREIKDPAALTDAFFGRRPETQEGIAALARAHLAIGQLASARALIAPYWRKTPLEAPGEAALIAEFGSLLTPADHRGRMEAMLYRGRHRAAARVAEMAGAQALQAAWSEAARKGPKAAKLLDAVPAELRQDGYHFARALHLRKTGKLAGAAAELAMVQRAADPAELADERHVLARALLNAGEAQRAYDIARAETAPGSDGAENAFLAGWIALRFLKTPEKAQAEFSKLAAMATTPQTLSRAHYWLGRTEEAAGKASAASSYAKAARQGAVFYGQLAAARLGQTHGPTTQPIADAGDAARFAGREMVQVITRLEAAGLQGLAAQFYRRLAETLDSPGEVALLMQLAEKRGDHHQGLLVAKAAARRGLAIGGLAHPVGAIPGEGSVLAYAVARQESEFNAGAVSPAGARGLLQLLPGTAAEMARKTGQAFSRERLTSDPGYNAALGSAYLETLKSRFGGSYVLAFAGYNAGPGRASQWVKEFGDPRGRDLDGVVDWIEQIPFAETRNYVQRVMENFQAYKQRLGGRPDIAADMTAVQQ